MASVNKVILLGNVGADPEVRYTSGGEPIANLRIATSESWKDKSGTKQERTEWHRLSFFGKLAEIAGEYLKKGSQIYVEGRIQTRKWTDKDGQDRYTTEIVVNEMKMLGGGRGGSGAQTAAPAQAAATDPESPRPAQVQKPAPTGGGSGFDDMEDDIPF